MREIKLTQEYIKKRLSYNPETGLFTWGVPRRGGFKAGEIAGCIDSQGYVAIRICGGVHRAHRLAWLYMYGKYPKHQIDHINRIRTDNSIKNLRDVPQSINAKNCNIRSDNKTGVTGVKLLKATGLYNATIHIGGEVIRLGSFKTLLSAAKVRWEAEVKYNYPNCNTTSSALSYIDNADQTQETPCPKIKTNSSPQN